MPACGSDDSDGEEKGSVLADLTVTVTYPGSEAGTLNMGVFPSPTPVTMPEHTHVEPDVTFPFTITFEDVPDGTWYTVAFFDVGSDGSPSPEADDVFVMHDGLEITESKTYSLTIDLPQAP
jgi:hypothetical protein